MQTASLTRIYGLFLRQLYLIRRSGVRVITYTFWPTIMVLIWGFMNKYLYGQMKVVQFTFATLLGATLLNTFFERTNVNVMFSFLEDVWARNIGNILITPIRPVELIVGYILNGIISVLVGVAVACLCSYAIFGFSFYDIGWPALAYILVLTVFGWCVGLSLISVILRFGPSGESFGWMIAFSFTPLVAIYYPVTVLPTWLQHVSWALPPTYAFESLRELTQTGYFDTAFFERAMLLNALYLCFSLTAFYVQLKKARQRGGLFSMSE